MARTGASFREALVAELAAASRGGLDRQLAFPAELYVSIAKDEGILVGAFDRRPPGVLATATVVRRGSGGPPVQVGRGTVHVALSLAHPGALVPCDEKRIVNRYVRPLLRALTGTSKSQAHYFGRDWVSLAHRPVAWVGFGHDATTRRTLFEAFVAVRRPFASAGRASFLGHPPATLEELAGREVDVEALAASIAASYGPDAHAATLGEGELAAGGAVEDVPWRATQEEAIGQVGAGPDSRGVFRVGGEILVSRDAIERLEASLAGAKGITRDEVGRLVDASLAAPGVALEGVRSLTSVRDAIAAAL